MNSMVAQVYSIPELLAETFQTLDEAARKNLHPALILSLKRIYITGCGDSHHAGLTTQLAFEKLTGLPTIVNTALDFARYKAGFMPKTGPNTNLMIGISVSGSVARTYEAIIMGKTSGATTLSLTAAAESRVGGCGDILFHVPNPPFSIPEGEASPGVRSFFINQVALLLMAIRIGEVRGRITTPEANGYRKELQGLGSVIEETIQKNADIIQKFAQETRSADKFVFVGGGPNYGCALFSAAKVLEASGDSALGQDTEEWAHLQYFAKTKRTPTFFITAADRDLSRMDEVVTAAQQIGRQVILIAPETAKTLIDKSHFAFTFLPVSEMYSALVTQVPTELFAAYRAGILEEPFFRNFGGGRNVEGGGGISRIQTSDCWKSWKV